MKRAPNHKGICKAAAALGVHRTHLRQVLQGERHGASLLQRFDLWVASLDGAAPAIPAPSAGASESATRIACEQWLQAVRAVAARDKCPWPVAWRIAREKHPTLYRAMVTAPSPFNQGLAKAPVQPFPAVTGGLTDCGGPEAEVRAS
jgi:hypothetical protein